jgi:hypothetical protein
LLNQDETRRRATARRIKKIARAQFVIWTEGSPAVHRQPVERILKKL